MVLLFVVCGWREETVVGVCQRTYLVHSTYVFFCTRGYERRKIVNPAVPLHHQVTLQPVFFYNLYRLVWATKVALATICLVFPALVLGYYFFIVESMTYQFLHRLKNLYDYVLLAVIVLIFPASYHRNLYDILVPTLISIH